MQIQELLIHLGGSLLHIILMWSPIIGLSWLSSQFVRLLGRRLTIAVGIVGIPVHELSHAAACILCGHKIKKIVLFKLSADGTMGYVNHAYRPTLLTPFTMMIIGIAPIFGAWVAIYGFTWTLMPGALSLWDWHVQHQNTWSAVWGFFAEIIRWLISDNATIQNWLWVIMCFSVLIFSAPSKVDLKGCEAGLITLFVIYVTWTIFVGPTEEALLPVFNVIMTTMMPVYATLGILLALIGAVKMSRLFKRKTELPDMYPPPS